MRGGELDTRGVTALDLDPLVTLAMRLRGEQNSYSVIAAACGRSVSWVQSVLKKAAIAISTERELYLAQQFSECAMLKRGLLRRYEEKQQPWNPQDIAAFLKIMEREAKLLGLDSPIKIEGRFDFTGRTEAELEALLAVNGLPPGLPQPTES